MCQNSSRSPILSSDCSGTDSNYCGGTAVPCCQEKGSGSALSCESRAHTAGKDLKDPATISILHSVRTTARKLVGAVSSKGRGSVSRQRKSVQQRVEGSR